MATQCGLWANNWKRSIPLSTLCGWADVVFIPWRNQCLDYILAQASPSTLDWFVDWHWPLLWIAWLCSILLPRYLGTWEVCPGCRQSIYLPSVLLERAYPLSGIIWHLIWSSVMRKSATRSQIIAGCHETSIVMLNWVPTSWNVVSQLSACLGSFAFGPGHPFMTAPWILARRY